MISLDKELQRVNVKQKSLRQIQAHSSIVKGIQNTVLTWHIKDRIQNLTYSKPEIHSESWYIQNPQNIDNSGIFKIQGLFRHLRCQTFTMNRFMKTVKGKWFRNISLPRSLLHEINIMRQLPQRQLFYVKKLWGAREPGTVKF